MSVTTWKTSSWNSLERSISGREAYKRKWEMTYSFSRWTRWASFAWRTWWTLQWKMISSVVTMDKDIIFIKCNKHLQYVGPFQWTESKYHKYTQRSIPAYSTNPFLGWSFEIFNSFCYCTKCNHSLFLFLFATKHFRPGSGCTEVTYGPCLLPNSVKKFLTFSGAEVVTFAKIFHLCLWVSCPVGGFLLKNLLCTDSHLATPSWSAVILLNISSISFSSGTQRSKSTYC